MNKSILVLTCMALSACAESKAPECQAGWKRCNGAAVEICNRNDLQWRQAQNCVESGYDDCAEVTVRYTEEDVAAPMCRGDEQEYSTCATEDTRRDVWVKDWICVDRGRPGQG
jgi:hypothetical protein